MNKLLKSEQGITLIELLATMSLIAIFIALSSTLIFQLFNDKEKTGNQIALSQHTNVILSELRNQFYEGKENLCSNKIGKDLSINSYTITNGETTLTINDGCINNVDHTKPLYLHLTASNNVGQEISVETTWNHRDNYTLTIVPVDDDNKDTEDGDSCHYKDDTIFDTKVTFHNSNATKCIVIFDKNATFLAGLTINTQGIVEVKGDLVLRGPSNFKNKGYLTVKGDMHIPPEGINIEGPWKRICVYGEIKGKEHINNLKIAETRSCSPQHKGADILQIKTP